MKARILMIMCLALSMAVLGCEKKSGDGADKDEAKAEEPADKADKPAEKAENEAASDDQAAEEDAPLEEVEVAKAGTEFDPPVQPEQLPDGAWYCDMGTAHWAAMEKPEDGKCPVCGMQLKQYDAEKHAEAKEGAVEAKGDHGHAHEGDDHAHGEGEEGHDHGEEDHAHEGDDHGHAH